MKQLISVILPVYNVEQYLPKCIESILHQTYENIEIILVDDGAKDFSGLLCDKYAEMDKRVKAFHKENGGLISAWVRGIEESSDDAEYIAFIDPDDWVSEKYIEKLVLTQEETEADVVAAPMTSVFPDVEKVSLNYLPSKLYEGETLKKEMFPVLLNVGNFDQRGIHMSRCSKLIKKQLVLDNIHYLDQKVTFCEDINIMFAVLLDAKSVAVISDLDCMYYYFQNPYSMLRSYDKRMLHSIKVVHESLFEICDEKNMNEMESQIYANYLVAAVQAYKNELQNPAEFHEINKNIYCIIENDIFRHAVKSVSWQGYKRKLNVLIIRLMASYGAKWTLILTYILKKAKKMKDVRLKYLSRKKRIFYGGMRAWKR